MTLQPLSEMSNRRAEREREIAVGRPPRRTITQVAKLRQWAADALCDGTNWRQTTDQGSIQKREHGAK